MSTAHLLNRELTVYRRQETPDGAGGFASDFEPVGTVACRVSQPKATQSITSEAVTAGQASARPRVPIYLDPEAQVFRGDELRGTGDFDQVGPEEIYRVAAIVYPSEQQWYKRADAIFHQPEPPQDGGGS